MCLAELHFVVYLWKINEDWSNIPIRWKKKSLEMVKERQITFWMSNKRLYHQRTLFTLQSRKQTIGNKWMKISILKAIFQVKKGIERMTVALCSFWGPVLIPVWSLWGLCLSSSCWRWYGLSAFPSVTIQC